MYIYVRSSISPLPIHINLTFFSLSLPPPVWIASIRLLCRDVSFSTDLQITGLNFLTGPNTETGRDPGTTPLSDTVTEDSDFASDVRWWVAFTVFLVF